MAAHHVKCSVTGLKPAQFSARLAYPDVPKTWFLDHQGLIRAH